MPTCLLQMDPPWPSPRHEQCLSLLLPSSTQPRPATFPQQRRWSYLFGGGGSSSSQCWRRWWPGAGKKARAARAEDKIPESLDSQFWYLHLLPALDSLLYGVYTFLSPHIFSTVAKSISISLLKFLVRAVPHYIHLTPKPLLPPPLPPMPPSPPPSFALILLSNLLPFLLHIIYRPPSGSEAARGYLHGGIFIDFVGQEAPASKVKLVVLDLLVLGLQVVMMALVLEKRGLEPPRMLADGSSPAGQHHRALAQDHDAEERGVLLPPSPITETRETFPSPSSAGRLRVDQDRDPDVLEDTRSSVARTEYHPLDDFRAGQYVVANLHLMNIMRAEWTRYNDHAARTSGLGDAIGRRSARRDDGRDAVRGGNWGARLRFVAVLGRTGVWEGKKE